MRLVIVVDACWLKLLLSTLTFFSYANLSFCGAFGSTTTTTSISSSRKRHCCHRAPVVARFGWLQEYFEPKKSLSSSSSLQSRQVQYPEQYPATYELNTDVVAKDDESSTGSPEAKLVRPLLKNTQLQTRPLQLVYDAVKHGWNAAAFHQAVDGKGAAVVLAKTNEGKFCGGYNPKGWASLGGARPSVAAFVFYETTTCHDGSSSNSSSSSARSFKKLQKVGGGGLACARDDPNFGISFGPDALVIGLQPGAREKLAQSKLGPYFERGPDDLSSLFDDHGGATELVDLKVLVGCYENGEDIPYSGGVLDMTSG